MNSEMWIPGENCDVILTHYKHDPIPLVCYRIQSDAIGPRVRIHFETYWPEGEAVSRDGKPKTVRRSKKDINTSTRLSPGVKRTASIF